jgi:hypothetical protein
VEGKNFSFVGRVTLAKSVIQALPSYVMQTLLLKSVEVSFEVIKRILKNLTL